MQKLLLRIAFVLITFAGGVTVSKVATFFRSGTSNIKTAPESVVAAPRPETISPCERAPDLPIPIKVLLDRNFPGWEFPLVSNDDCQTVKDWGGPDAHPEFIQGDFDGNGRIDYAVLIEHGSATDNTGVVIGPNVYVVAFLDSNSGYRMRTVTREGGGCLQLMRKGDGDYDYEAQREFTYAHDTIFSGWGMGGISYLYENGKFRAIITSD